MAASDVSNIFVLARLPSLGPIVHGTQHGEREGERERESVSETRPSFLTFYLRVLEQNDTLVIVALPLSSFSLTKGRLGVRFQ
jgi:hypothetical protein